MGGGGEHESENKTRSRDQFDLTNGFCTSSLYVMLYRAFRSDIVISYKWP